MLPGCSAQMADRDRPAQLASSEIISEIGNQMLFLDPRRRQEGLLGVCALRRRGLSQVRSLPQLLRSSPTGAC